MRIPWRFSQAVHAVAERTPTLGQLQGTLRSLRDRGSSIVGGLGRGSDVMRRLGPGGPIGGLALLLVCGILGATNRGLAGAVVGGLSGSVLGVALGAAASYAFTALPFLPQKGRRATVRLQMERDNARFLPGDTVTGQLLVSADRSVRLQGGTIYLACRGFQVYDKAQENGSREPQFARSSKEHLVEQLDVVPSAVVRQGGTLSFPFSFELPLRALPTHKGYVYSVLWTLHAVVRLPDGAEAKARQEILVESIPPTVRGVEGEHQAIAPTQACQMVLSLPSVLAGEGERIEAQVRITPITSLSLTEVRAVLLRVENIPAGDDHTVYVAEWNADTGMFRAERQPGGRGTTYVWLESEAVLSGPVQLAAAESVIHRFALEVPREWRPTLSHPDGRVTWKVGVIATRPEQSDLRAFHEVIVHTASSQPRAMLSRSLRG
mgnify:CR=1 FL=1